MDKIMTEDPESFIDFTAWTTQQHVRYFLLKVTVTANNNGFLVAKTPEKN